jgi:hypothetical protein
MDNVKIKGAVVNEPNPVLRLNNGDLLLWYNAYGELKGAFMVVSFRKQGHDQSCFNTNQHCSLLNFDDGTLAFDERCSRNTTVNRILCHLNRGSYNGGTSHLDYSNPGNQRIKQFRSGNYQIELSLLKEEI